MLKRIGAVLLGLLAASVVMTVFEFTNSFLFPFPAGIDIDNIDAVRAFTAALPWTAYLLVLLGWFLGALLGGFVVSRFLKAKTRGPALALAMLLIVAGIANNVMIGAPMLMSVLGAAIFLGGSLLGHVWFLRARTT